MSFDPTTLKGPDPTQWDDREFEGPVPAGRYVFQAPTDFEFTDDGGYLGVVMELKIQDCPEGHFDSIRYVRASFKPKRSGNGSRLTDYLKACRIDPLADNNPEAAMQAVESTAGCLFEAQVSWSAWDKDEREQLANDYAQFPDDPDKPGDKLPYIVNPKTNKKIPARAGVLYFIKS
jgi:hypothetical protein